MSDKKVDELRLWMKSNGIWHKALYNMLSEEDVATEQDFKSLPLLDVIYIIDDAKEAGFPYESKLKKLHGGFTEKTKRESVLAIVSNHSIETQQFIENKTDNILPIQNAKPKTKTKIKKKQIKIEKYENKNENEISESKNEENISAKLNVSKPSKTKKKKSNKSNKSKASKSRDSKDLKMECRPTMEQYLRENGIWQIDLFDIITDEYKIYSPQKLQQYKSDKEWVNEFMLKAKRCGMMSEQANKLAVYCGVKKGKKKKKERKNKSLVPMKKNKNKKVNRQKKAKSSANLSTEALKTMDPKEKENIARNKMEPFMTKNGFWQKDLFLVLLEYDIFTPKDLNGLSKSDRKEIIKKAKQRGAMGQKIKKFKAHFV